MSTALISAHDAKLPTTYVNAKDALAKCSSVDECGEWADKAEALASYGRQANDRGMVEMATRIRARAIRRAGELLKQVPSAQGTRNDLGSPGNLSGKVAAGKTAGLSAKQIKQATKLAKIPADTFEMAVEATPPPTTQQLAAAAKHADPYFPKATAALGTLRRFAEFCGANDPERVAFAVMGHEVASVKAAVNTIDVWLDVFVTNVGK